MDALIFIDSKIVSLPFVEFEKYHKKYLSHDSLTAKERFVKAGGKLPDKKKTG